MIKKILLTIIVIFISTILITFVFPEKMTLLTKDTFLEKTILNTTKIKNDIDDFFSNFDIIWKYKSTKDQALEIKQEIWSGITETQNQIDKIRTGVDETQKAIEQTKNWIDNTLKWLDEIQGTAKDIIPKTATWIVDTKEKIEKLRNSLDKTKNWIIETWSWINSVIESWNKVIN